LAVSRALVSFSCMFVLTAAWIRNRMFSSMVAFGAGGVKELAIVRYFITKLNRDLTEGSCTERNDDLGTVHRLCDCLRRRKLYTRVHRDVCT
jgi:hypothetical protein